MAEEIITETNRETATDHAYGGAQIQVLTGTGEQGLEVFDVRGDDELVTPTLEQIQHLPARSFNARRFGRQYFFDAIWQQPAVYRCHFAIPLSTWAASLQ